MRRAASICFSSVDEQRHADACCRTTLARSFDGIEITQPRPDRLRWSVPRALRHQAQIVRLDAQRVRDHLVGDGRTRGSCALQHVAQYFDITILDMARSRADAA